MARGQLATRLPRLATGVVLMYGLSACGNGGGVSNRPEEPPSAQANSTSAPLGESPAPTRGPNQGVEGTVVRFTAGSVVVEAVIEEDSATTRSFLQMLPMTLGFSDYGGQEEVSSPPEEFDYAGAEGMQPNVGDLFSYRPWGNLGFFYNTDGSTYSDSLVRIATTDDIDQIERLDGKDVTIAIAN